MNRRGFTLIEVNMAIAIMMAGVLTYVALYSLGFRESRQNREDVTSAAFADAVISPIVNAASATNLSWQAFDKLTTLPESKNSANPGWEAYLDAETGVVTADPTDMAKQVFNDIMAALGAGSSYKFPDNANGGLMPGLVVLRDKSVKANGGSGSTFNGRVLKIAFRACRTKDLLMSAPLYYTEVRFQGDPDGTGGVK